MALVAMAFAMVGCAKHVGGGEPPVPAPTPKNTVVPEEKPENLGVPYLYNFFVSGTKVFRATMAGTVRFDEICLSANADFDEYCIMNDIVGWQVEGQSESVAKSDEFSANTNFNAVFKDTTENIVHKYSFKNAGEQVGDIFRKAGEVTFGEINYLDPRVEVLF